MFDSDMNRVDFKGYRADCTTEFALDFLRNRAVGDPFFLFVSYIEPHHQNDRMRYEGPEGSKEKFKDYEVPGDLIGTQGDWRENYPDYLGCCNSLDYNVGRIRDELEKLGLADNTIIIYTSDHGSHFMTRNQEYKRSCHEGCIRIPLIIRGPGFKGGSVINELVSLIDLPPTLMASAGVQIPPYMRGRPLQQLIVNEPPDWPDDVFIQISESQIGRALRTKRWKYSVSAPGKAGWEDSCSDVYCEEFLYDLDKDPHERNNLIAEPGYDQVKQELKSRLVRRMIDAGEREPVIHSVI